MFDWSESVPTLVVPDNPWLKKKKIWKEIISNKYIQIAQVLIDQIIYDLLKKFMELKSSLLSFVFLYIKSILELKFLNSTCDLAVPFIRCLCFLQFKTSCNQAFRDSICFVYNSSGYILAHTNEEKKVKKHTNISFGDTYPFS